ncbi:MAG TPA: zf-HC2 domain-containing protein [Streptosporangiaceae bacterium]|nr:zf-HC2 domain-containing protein [Streptosporangiaceae bacterium]
MTCLMMTSLGVYVLGAAEHEERRKVEEHLPHCESCRAELIRLAPIPALLAAVPLEAAPRQPREVVKEPQAARSARPPRRVRWLPGVAGLAASAAAAAVLITGPFSSPARPGAHQVAPVTLSGISQASHVHATARLLATSWGTSIRLTVRGVPLNVRCRLVVRSTAGGAETTGLWEAWREGPITVPASADWRPSDIASLAVIAGHTTLVTIKSAPMSPARPASRAGR